MIQRIQSLYLLLTTVMLSLLLVLPVTQSTLPNGDPVTLMLYEGTAYWSSVVGICCAIWTGVIVLLSLVTIFLYGRRDIQLRLCTFLVVMIALLLAAMGVMFAIEESHMPTSLHRSLSVLLVPFSLVMSLLARGRVAHDEKLVRSLDRIR